MRMGAAGEKGVLQLMGSGQIVLKKGEERVIFLLFSSPSFPPLDGLLSSPLPVPVPKIDLLK